MVSGVWCFRFKLREIRRLYGAGECFGSAETVVVPGRGGLAGAVPC